MANDLEKRRRKRNLARLPVIESCDGCGSCCMGQSSPPGFLGIAMHGVDHAYDDGDLEWYDSSPQEAKQAILDYIKKRNDTTWNGEWPCCWLDQETGGCKYYQHRPRICRDKSDGGVINVGDEACHSWRSEYSPGKES